MATHLQKQLQRAIKILLAEIKSLDEQMISHPAKHPKRDNRYQLRRRLQGVVGLLEAELDCPQPDPLFVQRLLSAGAAVLFMIPVVESTMNIWDRLSTDVAETIAETQVIIQGDGNTLNIELPTIAADGVFEPTLTVTATPETLTVRGEIPTPEVGGTLYVNE